jgi:hypothetical protein
MLGSLKSLKSLLYLVCSRQIHSEPTDGPSGQEYRLGLDPGTDQESV